MYWTRELVVLMVFCIIVPINICPLSKLAAQDPQTNQRKLSYNIFPIIMYDSDIGFGFGAKGIVKNIYQKNESFDLILFASTKGEQWYVFTFSIPDFEIRQGTKYNLAFDAKVEYNKYLKSNFFGFGNDTRDNDWQFPRETTGIELTLGRAFTKTIIGEVRANYYFTSVYDYEERNPLMTTEIPGEGSNKTFYISLRLRWDSRDSQIHPQKGWHIETRTDLALNWFYADYTFNRYRIEMNRYLQLFNPSHIMAARLWGQHVQGTAPYYEQSIIGGGGTARGFKADRFIDNTMLLSSLEYRFKIYQRFGGVLFIDTGRVFQNFKKITITQWKSNWGWGLRYYLTNFLVRFDMGISQESTRIFFNFGHVF